MAISKGTEAVNDDDAIDFAMLKSCIRNLVNGLELLELVFGDNKMRAPGGSMLRDDDAESFLSEVSDHLSSLRSTFTNTKRSFISGFDSLAKGFNAADSLFGDMKAKLDELGKEIANKAATIDRLKQCITELEGVA